MNFVGMTQAESEPILIFSSRKLKKNNFLADLNGNPDASLFGIIGPASTFLLMTTKDINEKCCA